MVPTRTGHPFWMYEEMTQTPDALERLLAPDAPGVAQRDTAAERIAGARRVYLTGCGTAFHAALVGAAYLRDLCGGSIDARAVQSFELTNYEWRGMGERDVLVAMSHSGHPLATIAAITKAREAGAHTILVTGDSASPAAQVSDTILDVGYGEVKSFAYTISYSLMLALMADVASRVANAGQAMDGADAIARSLPGLHREAFALDETIHALAERLKAQRRWIFAGAGANHATAMEASLKMQETNYSASFGMEMEEVLHGPVAALGDAVLVVIAPKGHGRDRALDLLRAATVLGGPTVALGEAGDDELRGAAGDFLALPACDESISASVYHPPLHLLSYWLAVATGANPDLMRRQDAQYLEARRAYQL